MATFAHQLIGYTGVNVTFSAPDAFPSANVTAPAARCFLWVKNTSGSAENVTVVVPGTTFEQVNPDVVVSVPIGESLIGPLDANLFDVAGGVAFIIIDVTGITCAVVELPTPPPDLP
jgi:hypothetical protein